MVKKGQTHHKRESDISEARGANNFLFTKM